MTADQPTILATSGGLKPGRRTRSSSRRSPTTRSSSPASTGRAPRICLLATAHGRQPVRHLGVLRGGAASRAHCRLISPCCRCRTSTTSRATCSARTSSGSSAAASPALLALWRLHGARPMLREAWQAGVVLTGVLGRLDLLAHGRHDRLVRPGPAAGHQRPGVPAVLQRRALRLRGAAAAAVPVADRRRHAARRATRPTTASACSTAAPSSSRRSPRSTARAPTTSSAAPTAQPSKPHRPAPL